MAASVRGGVRKDRPAPRRGRLALFVPMRPRPVRNPEDDEAWACVAHVALTTDLRPVKNDREPCSMETGSMPQGV